MSTHSCITKTKNNNFLSNLILHQMYSRHQEEVDFFPLSKLLVQPYSHWANRRCEGLQNICVVHGEESERLEHPLTEGRIAYHQETAELEMVLGDFNISCKCLEKNIELHTVFIETLLHNIAMCLWGRSAHVALIVF